MRFTGTLALAALFLGASLAAPAMADCAYPKTPGAAPNGSKSTKEEMLAGKAALDKYQAEVNEYLACLDKESGESVAQAGDNADQVKQIKLLTVKRHNAAIEELTMRADEFNQQVRAFNKAKK